MVVGAMALVAAACGGDEATESVSSSSVATTAVTATTVPATETPGNDVATSTTAPPESAPPPVDGPPAPDFMLALDDGSDFVLSAEQKPVYMIFWAEW
jgi:hypothetical protein